MNEQTKKTGTIALCSLLLLAMVVALTLSGHPKEEEEPPEVASSQKTIDTICETTDYQNTCVDALKDSGSNTTDPKELIELAFKATIKYINEAAKKSVTIKEAEADPRAKSALETCAELSDMAANDLHRSLAKFSDFNFVNVNDILLELKIWLSGAITHQETCLDGFEDLPSDAGEKMRKVLKTAMEMSSNALAMVTELASVLEGLGVGGFQSRRLLADAFLLLPPLPVWADFEFPFRRALTASVNELKPNITVAKDGSGNYSTINEAMNDIPKKSNKTFVMYIKEGVYEEKVWFNTSLTHLMIVGDGPTKTRITGSLNVIDGTGTYRTATVAVQGDDFIARDIGFENSAGAEKHQAVALRVTSDRAIFYNCHMDGYQDTLYVHTYRQFYRDCVISGTIDFIFGDAAAVFQGCTFLVRKPMENQQNIVTAQGRKDVRQPTGLVLQNCTFKADSEYYPLRKKLKSYLGRPWKEYSRTVIMESFIDDLIQPEGWLKWNDTFALHTLFYTEFNNRGPGAPKGQRLKLAGVRELPAIRVQRFTAAEFLEGNRWIPQTRVPYAPGFIFPVPTEDPSVMYSPVVPEENKDLGGMVDKSSYIYKVNTSVSSPSPPEVGPEEVGVPKDILSDQPSIADPPVSESPAGSPISEPTTGTTASPTPAPATQPDPASSPSISPESDSTDGSGINPVSPSPATSTVDSSPAASPGAAAAPDSLSSM